MTADAMDNVRARVRKTAQDLQDAYTFKPQRQKVADAVNTVKQKVEGYFNKPQTQAPQQSKPAAPKPTAKPGSFKKGGTVQKTGYAKVHAGEKVLTKAQQKKGK